MKNEFLILKYIKAFILSLDNYVDNFPRKDRFLKDKIVMESYNVLELILYANMLEDNRKMKMQILSKFSLIDFCFEKAYKRKYLSEKQFNKITNDLTKMSKMVFGWMKNEK